MTPVAILAWPDEGAEARRLVEAGTAVLYLVSADEIPPVPTTCLEDWVRLPADDRDVAARVDALQRRAEAHLSPPRLDEFRRLAVGGRVLPLPSPEIELAALLADRFGQVVPDRDLVLAAALDGPGLLRAPVHRLRSTLRPLGLEVERARRLGYRLRHRAPLD